jgi:hypothetical protein
MRSRSPVRILLPAAQALAEGSWLAVVYAALQAAGGDLARLGPLELGALALGGMAWGRRQRWLSPKSDALGLPLLALASGCFGWLLDPDVRAGLVDGDLLLALSLHTPGWLAGLAFWRGEAHRVRADDTVTQDRLLRWAVPALAIPWLIGYASASGPREADFAAAAFVGTIVFSGSAFGALGLARLEAARASMGSEWRDNRSWLTLIVGVAVALTAFAIPAAALLGIPARSLLAVLVVPLQTLILLLVVLTAPIFILAAVVADLLRRMLPGDFRFEGFQLPHLTPWREPTSDLPGIILAIIIAGIFAFDLVLILVLLWVRYMEGRRRNAPDPLFEERSIVVPATSPAEPEPVNVSRSRRAADADDPAGAYLAALDELDADGRWPRQEHETPAAHLERARAEGLSISSFGRLAAAYQLVRYGSRPLGGREEGRARGRFEALRRWLRRG